MDKKIIQTPNAPEPIGPYSQIVEINGFIFLSGQVAIDPLTQSSIKNDIKTETMRVMENLKALLEAAGVDFTHVVKTTIYLTDMNNFPDVNAIYGSYFTENFPARETVQVSRLPKDFNVEISMIAYR